MYLVSFIETRGLEVSSSETLTPTKASFKAGILRNCLFSLSSRNDWPLQKEKESSKKNKYFPIGIKIIRVFYLNPLLKKIDLLKKVRLRFRIAPSSKVFIPLGFFCFFLPLKKKKEPLFIISPLRLRKRKGIFKISSNPSISLVQLPYRNCVLVRDHNSALQKHSGEYCRNRSYLRGY